MMILLILLGVIVYFAGFVVAGAWQERTCYLRDEGHVSNRAWESNDECNHPWSDPIPLIWPIAIAVIATVAPFWLFFGGAGKLSHRLAEVPTLAERRALREKQLRKLEQERAIERKANKKRVAELEAEVLGLKHDKELT